MNHKINVVVAPKAPDVTSDDSSSNIRSPRIEGLHEDYQDTRYYCRLSSGLDSFVPDLYLDLEGNKFEDRTGLALLNLQVTLMQDPKAP